MKKTKLILLLLSLAIVFLVTEIKSQDTIPHNIISNLKCRNLTPAFVSGRIADFAINPNNHSEYYVAAASGNIWKTTNNGTTFSSIFDNYGAYSIGCLAMDPKNTNIIWAGTGENNHQRAIGYGDGIYKSLDGGKSWKNMGLKKSMHIGMIAINPENTDIVYVAAEGSIWGPSDDRGLYKTTDGGKSWEKVLFISKNTGVNNVFLDIENPNTIFVTTEQRRRRTQTRIGGGPESSIRKSTDGGITWHKIEKGIPSVDKGGIGIDQSPVDPNILYAIVEAAQGKGGFFQSLDKGESWNKMSDHSSSGQYYTEIYCDPVNANKVISLETRSVVTLDGGKTWKRVGNNRKHVDDHAIWIDPNDTNHFLIGSDGGAYESFDNGANYIHKTNLPITQFYRVNVDNAKPFYNVYGGTQDNSSLGAPNQTLYSDGVTRGEWTITLGGDGFWQAIDPTDPNIVYSEFQYGNLFRHDKKSGEITSIKPREKEGDDYYKWNWNTPMILSPHNHKRLYIAANKVFKSDDRGQSWEQISGDITANIDRNKWSVMDRYWGVDAVAKDVSTSLYGMAVSMAESHIQEGLLYVGTDDGLIQKTEDNGKNWQKVENFSRVPKYTYVSDILPSKHDPNIVYASFDNIKRNDFKPYILKSTNKGKTWTSISGDLPENGTIHTIEQDTKNPKLLFVGTEFGAFFTIDEGKNWIPIKGGLPTIAIKDMVIQEDENDLVLASFGRGFYILDDISVLRTIKSDIKKEASIFPIKDAKLYVPKRRGGYGFGSMLYKTKNPTFGASFTYYLKEAPKTLKEKRKEAEKKLIKDKKPIPIASPKDQKKEKDEIAPYLEFEIKNKKGEIIRKITKKASKGINRVTWGLRKANTSPQESRKSIFDPLKTGGSAQLVTAGTYTVSMKLISSKETKLLVSETPFEVVPLNLTTLPAENPEELARYQDEINELVRVVEGAMKLNNELFNRTINIKQAAHRSEKAPLELLKRINDIEHSLRDIDWAFMGEKPKASPEEITPAPPSINNRLYAIAYANRNSLSDITKDQKEQYKLLKKEFSPLLDKLKIINDELLPVIEKELEDIGAPWTPGRIPIWKN